MKQRLLAVFAILTLAACSSQPQQSNQTAQQLLPAALTNYTVIVMDNGVISLEPGMKFAWKDPMAVVGVPESEEQAVSKRMQETIEKEIESHGYGFTDNLSQAPYSLVSVAILDEATSDADLDDFTLAFGLDPGLPTPTAQYGKGSLVVGVFDTQFGSLVWRGAVQVFTDHTLPADVKQQRAANAVRALLKELFSKRAGAQSSKQ
ncbi:Uncharacterised protein [BD1-7 clade bacterium]|uniref:DUF4136 domain-containing protein n=1 Tax=BD1-7 clade bacterium TaxID=2029982 RepID=A0A5S9QSN2_9GAMM|nr:Uncharacterised protein [BD1-7 clade bacterium]CAA0121344.1 Uncharacterised protein [BD1-7 clade bacterium]